MFAEGIKEASELLDHLNRGWQREFLLSFPIFVELLLGQVLHMTLKKKKKLFAATLLL